MLCDNASETCRRHVPTLWRYLFGDSLFGVVEAEDGEVYFAVDAVLIEVGQVAEDVSLAVLNHEDGVGFEHLGVEHQFGYGGEVGQIVSAKMMSNFVPHVSTNFSASPFT